VNSNKKLHQNIEATVGKFGWSGIFDNLATHWSFACGIKGIYCKLLFLVSARQTLTASSTNDQLVLRQAIEKGLNIRQYFAFDSETEDCSFQGFGQESTLKFYLHTTTHLIFVHNSHSFFVPLNNGCNW